MNAKNYLILLALLMNNVFIKAQVYNYAEDFPNPKDNSDSFICNPEDYLTLQEEDKINEIIEELRDKKDMKLQW